MFQRRPGCDACGLDLPPEAVLARIFTPRLHLPRWLHAAPDRRPGQGPGPATHPASFIRRYSRGSPRHVRRMAELPTPIPPEER